MLQLPSSRTAPWRLASLVTASAALLALPACLPSAEGAVGASLEQEVASSIGVIRVSASGSGCPRGSWRVRVSDDRTRVTLQFDRFSGSSGAGAGKSCDVRISLSGADGVAYAPAYLASRGEVDGSADGADGNGEASLATRIAWASGDLSEQTIGATVGDSFDETEALSARWSACRGARELRVRPHLAVRRGSAALNEQEIGFVARRCADAGAPDASTATTPPAPSEPSSPSGRSPQISKSVNCANTTTATEADGLMVLLPAHHVELAPPAPAAQRACYLQFDQVVQDGKTRAVQSYVVEGTVSLPANTNASVRVVPYVFGAGWQSSAGGQVLQSALLLEGPRAGAFSSEVSFADAELQFAPCSEGAAARLSLDVLTDITSVSPPSEGASLSVARVRAIKFKEKSCVP